MIRKFISSHNFVVQWPEQGKASFEILLRTIFSLQQVPVFPLAPKVIALCFHFHVDKKTSITHVCMYVHINACKCIFILNISNQFLNSLHFESMLFFHHFHGVQSGKEPWKLPCCSLRELRCAHILLDTDVDLTCP